MIQDELLQLDNDNRVRAIAPESFIVEAPAGAGKTELLTQRYLRLLSMVKDPEEIVAITFTNKAAAEMRSRILSSLQDAESELPVDKPHKQVTRKLALAALARDSELRWNLLAQPVRLRINTIDSLSSLLARQMPLLSRFGAQPAVIEDASAHYLEAASRTLASLEDEAGHSGEDGGPVSAALQYFDNDAQRLSAQLALMLAKREQWLPHTGKHSVEDEAATGLRHLIQHDINAAETVLHESLQLRLMPVARYAASNLPCEHCVALLLDWETPLLPRQESLSLWLALCDLLLTRDGELRKEKGLNIKNGLPATDEGRTHKQALVEIMAGIADAAPLAKLRKLPDLSNIAEEQRIVGALADLLKLAAAHLVTVFQETGEVDFVEVSQRALLALEDDSGPTDLALKLDYRIQHLLVDEFQDTSPAQVNLLKMLMTGWEDGDGRTIFCVGDPMQSIYRFRKAEVGRFLQVAKRGIGHLPLERLQLTRNNRSCPAVVSWVNYAFKDVFPAHDSVTRGAISYREFAATRDSLPEEGVLIHPLIAEQGASSEQLAELEAQQLADIIERERNVDPTRSIAVLVRARNHLHALVAEIRRKRPHLRFQAVEVEALAERQSVQDVLALASALLHRADRVNWLAILRAPWCGLTLADMHALAADNHHSTIWQLMHDEARIACLSDDGRQRLLHVRAVLTEAFAHQGRLSVRRWVESSWLKLGGAQCLWDAGDVRDVQALLDLMDKLDSSGRFNIAALEEAIAKLYAAPDVHADGWPQFMTIHKSKGLEFDTVILPGLHRQANKNDAPLVLWEEIPIDEAPPQLIAAPWRPKHLRDDKPSTYDYLQGLESERSANEAARVLYVAATRAIRRLHLVAAVKRNSSGEVKAPAGTLLELLWENVGGDFRRAAEQTPPLDKVPNADEAIFVPQLIRLTAPAVPQIFSQNVLAVKTSYDESPAPDGAEAQRGNKLAASIGTLAHLYMEMIARDGLQVWPASRLAALTPFMAHWLAAQGHNEQQAAQGAAQVSDALCATLASEHGCWLLQGRVDSAYELAITQADKQLISTHVVDRTFVENNERWIIDYKSARLEINISEAELQQQAERYRAQLEGYATLFKHEGIPIRLGIFFLSIGKLILL